MDKGQWQSKSPKGQPERGYVSVYHQNGWVTEEVPERSDTIRISCTEVLLYAFFIILAIVLLLTVFFGSAEWGALQYALEVR